MNAIWRCPYDKRREVLMIGDTKLVVEGLYNDGQGETPLSGGGAVAPVKPDFEINVIYMLVPTQQGDIPIDVTQLLEDVNSVTWKKECSNDLFEYITEKLVGICSAEGI